MANKYKLNYNVIYNGVNYLAKVESECQTSCPMGSLIGTMKKTIEPNITFESHVFEVLRHNFTHEHTFPTIHSEAYVVNLNATIAVNDRRGQPFNCSVVFCISKVQKICFDIVINDCSSEGIKYSNIYRKCRAILNKNGLFILNGLNVLFKDSLEIFDDNLNRFVTFDKCSQHITNGSLLRIKNEFVFTQMDWTQRLDLALNDSNLSDDDLMKSFRTLKDMSFKSLPRNRENFVNFMLEKGVNSDETVIWRLWAIYNRAVKSFVSDPVQCQDITGNTSTVGLNVQSNSGQNSGIMSGRKCYFVDKSRGNCGEYSGSDASIVKESQSKEVVVKKEVMSETDSESHESYDSEDINDSKSERDLKNDKLVTNCNLLYENDTKSEMHSQRKAIAIKRQMLSKDDNNESSESEDSTDSESDLTSLTRKKSELVPKQKKCINKEKKIKREVSSESEEDSEYSSDCVIICDEKAKIELSDNPEKSGTKNAEEVDYYLILSLNNCLQSMANEVLRQTSSDLWKTVSFQMMFDHKKPEMNETECQIRFEELFAKYLRVLSTFKTPFEASLSFKCFDLFNALDLQLLDSLADNWRQRLVTNLFHKLKTQSDNNRNEETIENKIKINTENE